MTMNGRPKPGTDLPILAEHLPGSEVVEFSLPLHVSKRCGHDGQPDVYTVAIWWDAVLLPLCHFQTLEEAVAPLRSLLERVTLPTECVGDRTT